MLEHPKQLNITQSEFTSDVSDYFDNLLAQRDAILARYGLTPETAEEFCNLRSTDEDREKMLVLYERMVYVIEHKRISPKEKVGKSHLAQEIMKEDFFGIEAVEKTFNIRLNVDDVPDIPFTFGDLDRAKELRQFLILRIDKIDEDTPLTIEQMERMYADESMNKGQGVVANVNSNYKASDWYWKSTPQYSWALVSKDIIPDSTNKNYLEQTDLIIRYLKNNIFKDQEIPEEFEFAIEEFEQIKQELQQLIDDRDYETVGKKFEELVLTKLVRHTPVEVLYDLLMYVQNTGIRLLNDKYTWTSGFAFYNGLPIQVGCFVLNGAYITAHSVYDKYNSLGVTFSRRF